MAQVVQFGLLGLGLAAVYTLLGSGIVLIYRGSGVVNFAQGTFALAGAAIFTELRSSNTSVPLALIAAVVGVAVIGILVQNVVMRPLRNSAPIARVIATLGVFIVMIAIGTLHYEANVIIVNEFLPSSQLHFAGISLESDRLILFGIAVAAVFALMAYQQRTLVGLATRAAAENETSAATVGWSANQLATVNWAIGGAMAGLAGALIVPVTGLIVENMALLVIPALAAALLGRFDNFPLTLLGATVIGIAQSLADRYSAQPGLSDALPFLVIIAVLVVTGRALPLRSHLTDRLPSIGRGIIRPIPLLLLLGGSLVLLIFVFNATWQGAFTVSLEEAILLLSIVVVTGYAGQISLVQYTLAGLGAYVAGRLIAADGWPFWAACVAGMVAAVPIGAVFAIPALRTRGVNLAVVTLGLGVSVNGLLFNNVNYTGGIIGTSVGNANFFGLDIAQLSHPNRYAVFVLLLFVACALAVANLRRSMIGRRLIAIRENERAASALGISVTASKLYAFVVGTVLASIAGETIAFQFPTVIYTNFDPVSSINAVAYAVIGGVGYIFGPLLGSLVTPGGAGSLFQGLLSGINRYLALIGGGVVIIVLLSDPNGLVSLNLAAARAELKSKAAYLRPEVLLILAVRRLARFFPRGPVERLEARRREKATATRTKLLGAGVHERVEPKELEVAGLSVRFGGVVAVADVSLTVRPGEIVGLLGPNGAGKTTLIDAVTGFVPAAGGEIRLAGRSLAGVSVSGRARAGIGRSWQSLEIFEDITVLENLQIASDSATPGWSQGLRALLWPARPSLGAAATAAVAAFGLSEHLDRLPGDLAYGERRLLGIGRTVAANPSVLLLDEPAAGLSEVESRELGTLIQTLARDWGMTVLLVEHDVNLVMSISDRIVVLDFGHKIAEGPPAEVRNDPAVIAAYLGVEESAAEVETATASGAGAGAVGTAMLEPLPSEADLDHAGAIFQEQPVEPGLGDASPGRIRPRDGERPVVLAKGLFAGYNDRPVVHDLDLHVNAGEVVALLGPNGAGKTTTLRSLTGLLPPLGGEVWFDGQQTRAPLYRRAKRGLAFVTETRSVFMSLSTAENLRVGRADTSIAVDLFPELVPLMDRTAGSLSGGEQQILTLARALARRPRLIVADELSLGLAPLVVRRLLDALRRAADEQGVAVLLVEQHVNQALRLADRVYVMRRGAILSSGTSAEVAPHLQEAYLTEA